MCKGISDALSRLVDKSLVLVETRDGETRYRMLETIRQYAHEKLNESDECANAQNRHLDYFVKLAEEAEPKLQAAEQAIWFKRLEPELDNFRRALDWSNNTRIEMGLRLGGALWYFWGNFGLWSEAYERLIRLLQDNGENTLTRAKVLRVAAEMASRSGYADQANTLFEETIRILRGLGDEGKHWLAQAIARYAWANMDRDLVRASALAEESVRMSRQTRDA